MTGLSELLKSLDNDCEILLPKLHGVGGTQKMRENYKKFLQRNSYNLKEINLYNALFSRRKIIFVFLWYHLFWYGLLRIQGNQIIYRPNSNETNILTSGKSIKHKLYVQLYKLSKQLRLPNLIIAQNTEIEKEWIDYKTILIHNFITSNSQLKKTEKKKSKKGIFVGRYSEEKEVELTIKYAVKHKIDITFYLSGPVSNLNYEKITWNKAPNYNDFDYLVITSRYEGFPNVVLEARASNLMVFGLNRIKVLKEIQHFSECIFLFPTMEELFLELNFPKDYIVSNEFFLKNYLVQNK